TEMGRIPEGPPGETVRAGLLAASIAFLRDAIPSGEYLGWVASPADEPGTIVAGAGVQRRRTLPHPSFRLRPGHLAEGRQAIVLNVYTEPAWRRRGIADALMRDIIA